ncbi:MAG: efflux RND transporter periplasmic adaptor subunit [Bacteroidota bacterium]
MKSLAYLGLIIASAFVFTACNQENRANTTAEGNESEREERVFPVKVERIKYEVIPRTLDYTANLEPFKELHFAPASPGRIKKIFVEVGEKVSKEQVLVEMDRTQLNQALTQLENARSNFQRIDTLYKLNSISEQQYEQAKSQYELAQSNVEFLAENTTLIAPFEAIITGKHYENGEVYSGAPNTQAGKAAIVSLMQINPLKAVVNISQNYYPFLEEGMSARVTSDIFPDEVFKGEVYKKYPTINPATRTFQTEIMIRNPNEKIRPGMYSVIELELNREKALVVPAIAVLKQEGTNNRYVFINEDGTARQLQVKIGRRFDEKVELIANAVQEGMDLIVEGQASLLNGSKLNVID